jgi:maltodextrin utilization protein YvdJ
MAPILAPIITQLFSQGLNILGNAVLAKGQDVVEEKLGVKLETASSETLRKMEIEHEEFLISIAQQQKEAEIAAEQVAQSNITDRWKADMLSDSWLSKNIRPLVLLYLLSVYTIFSVISAADINVNPAYVELLAQMLMLVMGAYFVGRTVEKVKNIGEVGKTNREGDKK